jgi:hypothetical protein
MKFLRVEHLGVALFGRLLCEVGFRSHLSGPPLRILE